MGFHPDVIRALLNAGANASIVDSEGKTAAQASAHKFYGVGLETVNSFLDESSRKDIKVDWEASSFLQMVSSLNHIMHLQILEFIAGERS